MTGDILFKANAPHKPTPGETPELDLGLTQGGAPVVTPATNTENFVADVIETSKTIPVIVDFWAPWSGPCKTLRPRLEKLVSRTGGLVKMIRVNVDENQDLAAQLRVQSVPTIYAFKDARPVDVFAGALPERQIQNFIDRLIGNAQPPLEAALDKAQDLLEENNAVEAETIYADILAKDPSFSPAIAGMIRTIVAREDLPRADEFIAGLDAKTRMEPEVAHAISVLDLAQQSTNAAHADITALEALITADADNLPVRFDLALALYAAERPREAIDHLLYIVTRDQTWNDEAARKQLILIFDALGPKNPLIEESRRRLSAALFA